MSYCHIRLVDIDGTELNPRNNISFELGFGQQPGDLIRSRVAAASCLRAQCSCEEFTDRTINGMPIPSAVYTASNSITSSGDADATEDNIVIFQAGRMIELTPGFEATDFFVAQIVDTLCDNNDGSIISIPSDLQLIRENQVSQSFNIYPNPASQELNLVYNLVEDGEISIRFTNQYGQMVQILEDKTLQQKGDYNRQIQLDGLPAGVYYITLQTSTERLVRSFVISRL